MSTDTTEENKIKNLKTDIKIMLELVEDSDIQLYLTKFYKENKSRGLKFLECMLDGLTTNSYEFIDTDLQFVSKSLSLSYYFIILLC